MIQDRWEVSKQYQVFATPFAFLVNECGTIAAAGIVSSKQYLGYLLEVAETYSERFSGETRLENTTADTAPAQQATEASVS